MDCPGLYVALAGGTEQDQSRIGKLFRHLPLRNKEPVNLDDPSKIVAVTRETNYLLPYDDGKRKYRYVVTAVDRFHNENQGKSKKVKL